MIKTLKIINKSHKDREKAIALWRAYRKISKHFKYFANVIALANT